MIRLVIEDIEADVFQTESIVGEYAVANIADVSKRAGLRSISFKLPKTANNKSIFESCEIPTSISDKPYKRLKARLYVDGMDMEILFTTLENVNEYYNVRLYGANSDLFANLKDLKLADLDLSAYNHHWSVDYLSQTIVFGHPIQYAVIDWNMDSPNTAISNVATDVYMGNMLPCVYENLLVEKVFNEAGYTLDNKLLLEPVMQERSPIIPLGTRTLERDKKFSRYIASFDMAQFTPFGSLTAGSVVVTNNLLSQSERYWVSGANANYANNTSAPFSYFKIPEKAKLKIRIKFEYKRNAGMANPIPFRFNLVPNQIPIIGTSTIPTPHFVNLSATNSWQSFDYTFDVECLEPSSSGLLDPDAVGFGLWIQDLGTSFASNHVINQNGLIEILEAESIEDRTEPFDIVYTVGSNTELYNIYDYITIANNLPDFTQADFIKEYLKKYGSIISINERSKVATIAPFRKIIDNIGQAVDWSGKVDFSEVPKTEFTLGYAQRNIFKYKDDDDVVKPPLTDYTLEINDSTLESEKVVIESKYSATETVTRLIGRKIPQIKCFEDYLFEKTVNPRCLYIAAETGTLNYRKNLGNTTGQYVMSGTNLIPYCYFIREAFPHGLGFGDDLVDKFYVYLFGIIDKAKKYELPIRLNTSDISTFDFLKPVYIKELDGYFYVNKFKFEYTSKKSSIVELIKLF
jgi:hypothetical protein